MYRQTKTKIKYKNHMAKLKELQSPKYTIDFVEICSKLDPTTTNKYVPYMLKLIEGYIEDVRKDYEEKTLKDIRDLVHDFDDLAERNQIENKDIYAYDSLETLEKIIKEGKSKITESQIKKSETTILYDDENYLVVRPLSVRSSRLYGATTKWCTASDRDDYSSHFTRYAGNGVLVYFINKKMDPKTNKTAKLAFHNETDFNGANNITMWDVEDKSLSAGETMGIIGKIIPYNIYELIQNELINGKKIKLITT